MASAHEVSGILGSITGLGVGIAFLVYIYNFKKKAIEKPSGKILLPGEEKIGEIYLDESKLILTTQRLLESSYNEKKTMLSLEPKDVSSTEIGKKGFLTEKPTFVLLYNHRKKNKTKTSTWVVPKKVKLGMFPVFPGVLIFGKTYKNTHTAETFNKLVLNWKKNNTQNN